LWLITTYFNPGNFATKRRNYERFAAPLLDAGIPLLTVECALGNAPFVLPAAPHVLQVRGPDVLWLKERLINLAIAGLPPHVEKIAWLDADILFVNPAWAQQTSALLDRFPVVQPFARVGRLGKDQGTFAGRARRSFASQLQRRAESAHLGGAAHGQPGIAWAAQRQLIARHGLYDAAIVGGGDELTPLAMASTVFVSGGLRACVSGGSRCLCRNYGIICCVYPGRHGLQNTIWRVSRRRLPLWSMSVSLRITCGGRSHLP
jgi:hypothetical protein